MVGNCYFVNFGCLMAVFVVGRVGFAGFIVFCFDLVVACCLCVFLWGVVCLVGCVVNSVFVGWCCLFI